MATIVWLLSLVDSITSETGLRSAVDVGVRIEELSGTYPVEPNGPAGYRSLAHETQQYDRSPYTPADYQEVTQVSVAELGADLRRPLDALLGRLLRTTGVGDILRLP